MKMYTYICFTCSTTFITKVKRKMNRAFCNTKCFAITRNKEHNISQLCHGCSNIFESPNWKQLKYCSTKCSGSVKSESWKITRNNPTLYWRNYLNKRRKKLLKGKCQNCQYSKYTQLCHKKALSTFSFDTPVEVVNSLENLVELCPNCHWEMDHLGLNITTSLALT